MAISRSVAGYNARPPWVTGYDRVIRVLVSLVDHRHVRAHRLGDAGHHQADAGLPHSCFVFILPVVRSFAHPIPDASRHRQFGFEGKNRSSHVPLVVMVSRNHTLLRGTS